MPCAWEMVSQLSSACNTYYGSAHSQHDSQDFSSQLPDQSLNEGRLVGRRGQNTCLRDRFALSALWAWAHIGRRLLTRPLPPLPTRAVLF